NGSSALTNRFRERRAPFAMPEILPKSRLRKLTILSLSPCFHARNTIAEELWDSVVRIDVSPGRTIFHDYCRKKSGRRLLAPRTALLDEEPLTHGRRQIAEVH